jgi:membrane-bound inhibitor of C-type lysozyme
MKQTFITTTLVFLLSACTSNIPDLPDNIVAKSYIFSCEDKGVIKVLYTMKGTEATLDISLPAFEIDKKTLHFFQAVSASGARYINDSNNNVTYEWHSKANYGQISMFSGTRNNFSVSCQLK